MSNKKSEILKGYDDFVEGKKRGTVAMYLITFISLVIAVLSMFFAYSQQKNAIDKVRVIDSEGRFVHTETEYRKKVFEVAIQDHLSRSIQYLNSFDMNSIKENQAKSFFLVDKHSAERVFASYRSQGAYNDALRNGYVYKTQLQKITRLDGKAEPFEVELEALTTIIDRNRILKFRIYGRGKIRYVTPNYPTNTQGMWLFDYTQDYVDITEEEEEKMNKAEEEKSREQKVEKAKVNQKKSENE